MSVAHTAITILSTPALRAPPLIHHLTHSTSTNTVPPHPVNNVFPPNNPQFLKDSFHALHSLINLIDAHLL